MICKNPLDLSQVGFSHGEGLYLNDTMGCEIHRGINFGGQPIGGECCHAKDTFQVSEQHLFIGYTRIHHYHYIRYICNIETCPLQLCTGELTNTSALSCVNASSVNLGSGANDGTVTLTWAASEVGFTRNIRVI